MEERKIAVISLSGGMDSTCLLIALLKMGYEVYGVSFDYGQKHKIELTRLWDNIIYLRSKGIKLMKYNKIKIPDVGKLFESSLLSDSCDDVPTGHYEQDNMKSTVVPNRNAIFSSIVYGYALSIAKREQSKVHVFLGVHSGDHAIYPDCTEPFFDKLNDAFMEGNYDSNMVEFRLPYMNANKTTLLRDCLKNCIELHIDFDTVLRNTNTSYNPDAQGRSSGTSGADIERIEAFLNIGRKDPVTYVNGWKKTKDNAIKIINNYANSN